MADNNPNLPTGAVPPKPPEASKVQPKKETVRISLPPKPSPTATIRLPTLPPGGPPPPASVTTSAGPVPPPPAVGAPQAPRVPVPGATTATSAAHRPGPAAPVGVARPAAAPLPSARPAPPAPASSGKRISALDTGLAIAAAVIGLGAVAYLFLGILSMN